MIHFTVYGKPEPAGSKRPFQNKHTGRISTVDANQKSRPWKIQVAQVARQVYDGPLLDGPVMATFVFYRPRPASHFFTGKRAGQLKPNAPPFPLSRPDALKLARGVEDALTGVVWRDDAQVVDGAQRKRWGEPARVEVFVEPITGESAPQPPASVLEG